MQTFSKSISKSFLLLFLVSVFSLSPFLSIAEDLSITAEVTGGTTGGTTGGSGGGGGGGGGYTSPTSVIFSGRAYPLSQITLLKDGQVALSTVAGPDANFLMTLSGITTGSYTFSIIGTDSNGLRSTLFTVPIFITSGATTTVSGIFLAPTIDTDKKEVLKGDNMIIFGQTVPSSSVVISVHSTEQFFNVTSDVAGAYLYTLDTSPLELGGHTTKSKATPSAGVVSSYGKIVDFKVSNFIDPNKPKDTNGCRNSDINCDKKVNLVDFSIVAFWYKKTDVPTKVDLNGDGKVTLVDFSIMAYYWTG
jgi:hypothetical protein